MILDIIIGIIVLGAVGAGVVAAYKYVRSTKAVKGNGGGKTVTTNDTVDIKKDDEGEGLQNFK